MTKFSPGRQPLLPRSEAPGFSSRESTTPSISRPLAAIQLPPIQTAVRAQCARSVTTSAVSSTTRTNTAAAVDGDQAGTCSLQLEMPAHTGVRAAPIERPLSENLGLSSAATS
jgi:hypothetical protein